MKLQGEAKKRSKPLTIILNVMHIFKWISSTDQCSAQHLACMWKTKHGACLWCQKPVCKWVWVESWWGKPACVQYLKLKEITLLELNDSNYGGENTLSFTHPWILSPRLTESKFVGLLFWQAYHSFLSFLNVTEGHTLVFGVWCLLSCAFSENSHVLAQCSAELKMPRNACTGAQRGEPAALLGVHSILAALAAAAVDVVTDKSFINLAPDIIYAQAAGRVTAKWPWNPANQQFF